MSFTQLLAYFILRVIWVMGCLFDSLYSFNKKGDVRISLIFLVELILVIILVISVYFAVNEKLENKDFYKGEYTMMYSYYTNLLESSPGNLILISDNAVNYELGYFTKNGNLVTLDNLNQKSGYYSVYPFLRSSISSDYGLSDLSRPTYFVKNGNNLKISNIDQR